ncbi:hypothetical protein BSNK01_04660 [Bacillaceae bacterium]
MNFTIAGLQIGPYDPQMTYEQRLEQFSCFLQQSVTPGSVQLVVFPELMTVPYKCVCYDDAYFDLAESLEGPTLRWLSRQAVKYKTAIVGTIFEKEEAGDGECRYYNTALLVSAEGELIGKYRKVHIPKLNLPSLKTDETYYFRPGDELPVFEVEGCNVGILICYDRSFPEAARTLALKGADVIVIPTTSAGKERASQWLDECSARARENGVFVVGVNRGGEERILDGLGKEMKLDYFGMSCAIGPRGEILAGPLEQKPWQTIQVTIDRAELEKAKEELPFLRDLRPEVYLGYPTKEILKLRDLRFAKEVEPTTAMILGGE